MATTTDPRIDEYIARAAPFAREILVKIRRAFHESGPEVTETIKWGRPAFETEHGLLGGMGAFQAHVALTLWRGLEIDDPDGIFEAGENRSMAWVRVPTRKALPAQRVLRDYIARAAARTAEVKRAGRPRKAAAKRRAAPTLPPELARAFALKQHAKARATYEAFSSSAQRDYVTWITSAKREATRTKRLETTLAWLAEGKRRNWKYEAC